MTATGACLPAGFRRAVFRFVDDVELLADEAAGATHVRSASRIGSSDLGVNRRRIEAVRARWGAAAPRSQASSLSQTFSVTAPPTEEMSTSEATVSRWKS